MTRPGIELAERVRRACLEAAQDAYEDAGLQGLCAEGRWECALEAIRRLALGPLMPQGNPEPQVDDPGQGGLDSR